MPRVKPLKELIPMLQKMYNKHGNMKIYFDTEAGQFLTHLVGITGVWYAPKEWLGVQHAYFSTSELIVHLKHKEMINLK